MKKLKNLFQRAVQHLIVIPRFGGVEGLAAEEGKVRLVEVGHSQFPCAQGLILEFQLAIGGVVAVFAVAQNGTADAGHVGADLVGAAGDQLRGS